MYSDYYLSMPEYLKKKNTCKTKTRIPTLPHAILHASKLQKIIVNMYYYILQISVMLFKTYQIL